MFLNARFWNNCADSQEAPALERRDSCLIDELRQKQWVNDINPHPPPCCRHAEFQLKRTFANSGATTRELTEPPPHQGAAGRGGAGSNKVCIDLLTSAWPLWPRLTEARSKTQTEQIHLHQTKSERGGSIRQSQEEVLPELSCRSYLKDCWAVSSPQKIDLIYCRRVNCPWGHEDCGERRQTEPHVALKLKSFHRDGSGGEGSSPKSPHVTAELGGEQTADLENRRFFSNI